MTKQHIPKIRFQGFDEEWEDKKIGEVFRERNQREAEGELISVTINSGVVRASELDRKDNSSKNKSNYKKVEVGDIAYNSMRMWQGASGVSNYSGIVSPAYTVIYPHENISVSIEFIAKLFKTSKMINVFQINSQGLTSDTWNLKYPLLKNIKISLPTLPEQESIGQLFRTLDELISAYKENLEQYQNLKTSMLSKMFPKEGQKQPEIRLDGFDGDWEERELGEEVNFLNEKRVPIDSSDRLSGCFPYYGASGVIDYIDNYIFDGEYVLLAEDGANIVMRNSPIAYLTSGKFWLNNHAHIMEMKEGSNVFLMNLLEKEDYVKYNTGTAQPKLNSKTVKKIKLYFPIPDEQEAIGAFFANLDETISSYQDKIGQLELLKKNLLAQMFI
ncbi:MAG: restriction endonuclease subunit S [Streptococcus sp.]|nr:restriction endonuclease subunit S [Streptococcus sp.]